MIATAAALMLLTTSAGPGAQRTGSAHFQVSLNVVAPMRAFAPATLDARAGAPRLGAEVTAPVTRVEPGGLVARFAPSAAVRGGAATVLVGLPGGTLRACGAAANDECEVALPRSDPAAPGSAVVVVAFVPDGAASRIVER